MKIVIANVPWRKGNRYGVRAGSRWPFTMELMPGQKIPSYMPFPFYLAYAASLLKKNGFDVTLVDAIAEGFTESEFYAKITALKPDVFVAETATPSIANDLAWVRRVKNSNPECRTVICGLHATIYPKDLLDTATFIDTIMAGEYEYTLLELCRAITDKKSFGDIQGLIYRDGKEVKINPRRVALDDLDSLPWPDREDLPMMNYNDSFAGLPVPNVQMWASRGCPYQCIFCNWPGTMYGGHKYRVRNYMDVVDEMEFLVKTYGFKAIYIDDDTVNIGKERMIAMSKEIKKRNLNTPWAIMARADTTDEETFRIMADAGLSAIKFGVESSSQQLVNNAKKGLKVDAVRGSVKLMKELGVKTHLTFSFGLPGETEETMEDTIQFALSLAPDSAQFSIVTPFPGTEYFKMLKDKNKILSEDWEKYDGNASAVFAPDGESIATLEKWHRYALNRWNEQLISASIKNRLSGLSDGRVA